MVKYNAKLDAIFNALADGTRRDILRRVSRKELAVSEIASSYGMSLPAVSKHLTVLESAGLVAKRRSGRRLYVSPSPPSLETAIAHLKRYEADLCERYDRLGDYLKDNEKDNGKN